MSTTAHQGTYQPLQTLPAPARVVDRRRYLLEEAAGLRVLHLGCVDDRLTEARLEAGVLLHQQLGSVASELTGVDISASGVELLRKRVPGDYLVGDVQRLETVSLPDAVDLVVASELIEHLPSPGGFLTGLCELLRSHSARAIVTTPNAYGWVSFGRMAVQRRESTHPDHLAVYSPFTFVASLENAGLRIEEFLIHDWERSPGMLNRARTLASAAVLKWNPHLGGGLVASVVAA